MGILDGGVPPGSPNPDPGPVTAVTPVMYICAAQRVLDFVHFGLEVVMVQLKELQECMNVFVDRFLNE